MKNVKRGKECEYNPALSRMDLKLLELGFFLSGLFIAGLLPSAVLKNYWGVWLVVAILVLIKPSYAYFKK